GQSGKLWEIGRPRAENPANRNSRTKIGLLEGDNEFFNRDAGDANQGAQGAWFHGLLSMDRHRKHVAVAWSLQDMVRPLHAILDEAEGGECLTDCFAGHGWQFRHRPRSSVACSVRRESLAHLATGYFRRGACRI